MSAASVGPFAGAFLDIDFNPRVLANFVFLEDAIFFDVVGADSLFVFLTFFSTSLSGGLITMVFGDADPASDALSDTFLSVFSDAYLIV